MTPRLTKEQAEAVDRVCRSDAPDTWYGMMEKRILDLKAENAAMRGATNEPPTPKD